MKEIRFDFAFMFRYSVRSGTAASKLKDDVPEHVKLRRLSEMIEMQHQISLEKIQQYVGKTEEVLVEKINEKIIGQVMGKTRTFQTVVFEGDEKLVGQVVKVDILEAKGLTLIGKML